MGRRHLTARAGPPFRRGLSAARIRPPAIRPTPPARHNGMRLTLIAVLLAAGCAPAINDSPEPATPSAAPPTVSVPPAATPTVPKLTADEHQIVYKVGGSATKALITYAVPSGQEQQNGASVPWRKAFKAPDYSVLSLSAQNKGTGTVRCEIDVDGKVKKKSTSSGAYAVVTCTASLGF